MESLIDDAQSRRDERHHKRSTMEKVDDFDNFLDFHSSSTSSTRTINMDIEDEHANELDNDESENIDNEIENVYGDDDSHENAFKKKTRKKTSKAWKEMEEIILADGSKKAKCNNCKGLFAMPNTSTTTQLLRHLKKCVARKANDKMQTNLTFNSLESETDGSNLTTFKYDHAKVRELAAHMTLYHEYHFNQMEHVLFNKFMRANTPHWQKISRATCKADCISTYEIEKKKLKTLLKGVNRIGITTDLWKSGQKIQYMVVTGHFIDSDWKLQKRVLNFCNIPPPHTGVIIADALQKCLADWGIQDKLSTITVDNASYNDACIRILKADLELRNKLFFGGKIFHVRCCAHIINLLVQDGLSQIGDIVDCVRDGVKYINASEARLRQFSDIRKHLQLPSKKLILDCPTRWNGTYMMLAAALVFKDVFPRFRDRDSGFKYVPSEEDWVKVKQVSEFLGLFNEVTNIISGSDYPTANLFFTEISRIKEVLNEKCGDLCDYISAMALKMRLKFDKYWGECNLLMAIGAVLDPRYKMALVEFCFPTIYSEGEAQRNITLVRETLYEVFNQYYDVYTTAQTEQINKEFEAESGSSGVDDSIGISIVTGKSKFESFVKRRKIIPLIKSDLDVYLEEGSISFEEFPNFDATLWWKENNLRFRVLSKMACDVLSIPVSTVASESTFSAGGRVIDPHRASLSTETVQILMCGSDWVRALHGLKKETHVNKGYVEIELS